jgi:hypothetical protein
VPSAGDAEAGGREDAAEAGGGSRIRCKSRIWLKMQLSPTDLPIPVNEFCVVPNPLEHEPFAFLTEFLVFETTVATDNIELEPDIARRFGGKSNRKNAPKLSGRSRAVLHAPEPPNIMSDFSPNAPAGFTDPDATLRPVNLGIDAGAVWKGVGGDTESWAPIDIECDIQMLQYLLQQNLRKYNQGD